MRRRQTTTDPISDEPLLMTVEQLAGLLNVGRSSAWKLAGSGVLDVVRVGRATRVVRASVDRWLVREAEAQRIEPLV